MQAATFNAEGCQPPIELNEYCEQLVATVPQQPGSEVTHEMDMEEPDLNESAAVCDASTDEDDEDTQPQEMARLHTKTSTAMPKRNAAKPKKQLVDDTSSDDDATDDEEDVVAALQAMEEEEADGVVARRLEGPLGDLTNTEVIISYSM